MKKSKDLLRKYLYAAKVARRSKRHVISLREKNLLENKNPNQFFKYIRSKLYYKSKVPCLTDEAGKILISNESKAIAFNDFFSSVFTTDDGKPLSINSRCSKLFSETQKINFTAVTVYKYLQKLPLKLSLGPDGLPFFI